MSPGDEPHRPTRPPPALEALLRRLLPPGTVGRSIVGDLREEMEHDHARGARWPRLRWARRATGVVLSYRLPSPSRTLASAAEAATGARRSVRSLARRPASSLAALLVLALGTALVTFVFAVVWGLSFREMDVPGAGELRTVTLLQGESPRPVTNQELRAWREGPTPLGGLAAYRTSTFNLSGEAQPPERRAGARMEPDAFRVLDVEPALGRGFTAADAAPGASPVALLGDLLWRTRFDGSPDVLGATVRIDGVPTTVVGVMPPDFRFPARHDLWLPLDAGAAEGAGIEPDPEAPAGTVFGRLPPGRDPATAAAALETVLARIPGAASGGAPRVRLDAPGRVVPALALLLAGMMGAALLVLVVACANVSGLLLARAAARAGEVGVRAALGAGPLRRAAPFLAEAALLAAAGSALGVLLASAAASRFELALAGTGRPWWMVVAVDEPVLAFALVVAVGVTGVTGAGPALLALRVGSGGSGPGGGRGILSGLEGPVGRALVIVQVALSCTLLVGTGLVVKSLVGLSRVDLPFARGDVLTARFRPTTATSPDSAARAGFYAEVLGGLRGLAGVEAVALSGGLPGFSVDETAVRTDEGEALPVERLPRALRAAGTPGVLATLGIPLLAGRDLLPTDEADAEPVAVVERETASLLFGEDDPIGRRFREVGAEGDGPWRRVVGLVDELHLEGMNQLDRGFGYYVPLAQADPPWVAAVVRTGRDPGTVVAELRALLAELDPDLALWDVLTMREVATSERWFFVAFGGVFAGFGAAALLMAAVGLYGVLSYTVARRVPEMGMRMALGAGAPAVARLVLSDALRQVGAGTAAGLLLSLALAGGLRVVLFEVEPRDPLVYLGVASVVAAVSLLAAAAPTARAVRLDPARALRDA